MPCVWERGRREDGDAGMGPRLLRLECWLLGVVNLQALRDGGMEGSWLWGGL